MNDAGHAPAPPSDGASDALLTAARDRFRAHGWSGAHVSAIAVAAGVAVSTLYSRFPSKELLYRAAMGVPPPSGTDGDAAPSGRARITREALVAAARAVIERDGFHAARIGDIAEQAGVSVGSFYTYFPAKLDVFTEVLRRALATELGPVQDPPPGPPGTDPTRRGGTDPTHRGGTDPTLRVRERIRSAVDRYVEGYPQQARLVQRVDEAIGAHPELVTLRLQLHHACADRITESIRTWALAGIVDRDLDPALAADALAAMVGQATQIWITYGQPHERTAAVDTLTRLWCNALGLRAGRPEPRADA